jgi:hypothetical protein
MNLHALRDIVRVDHPVYGPIDVDPDLQTVNVPEDLAAELLNIRVGGVPLWESEVDYDRRRAVAELERKRDPAQQALLLEKLVQITAQNAGVNIDTPVPAPPAPVIPAVTLPPVDPAAELAKVAAQAEARDYEAMGRNDLSALASDRGLNGGGSKADLVQRLRDKDAGEK